METMCTKRFLAMLAGAIFLLAISPLPGDAEVPQQINYQGYLTDDMGNPVADEVYSMRFAIYAVALGGTALWSETQPTITVTGGIYNVQIGQDPIGNPFPSGLFDSERYLGVNVENDGEMTPRQPISSVAFAMKAQDADNADMLEGYVADDFADAEHGHNFTDLTGTASDPQIPNGITIDHASSADHATSADNADTVDGQHAAAFAATSHTHSGSDINTGTVADARIASSLARDSEIWPTVLSHDGPGSGLNADYLDGLSSGSFLSTASDYGRPGVASNLYEGSQTLTSRYINNDRAETIQATSTASLLSVVQDGTGNAIAAQTDGAIAVRGQAAGTDGTGVAGYCYASAGSGVFGQGAGKGVWGHSTSTDGVGVYAYSKYSMAIDALTSSDSTNAWAPAIYGRNEGAGDGVYGWSQSRYGLVGVSNSGYAAIWARNNSTGPAIFAEGGSDGLAGDFRGRVKTTVLEITGGSDLSEQFDIRKTHKGLLPSPGMVVSIDPEHPGALRVAHTPYDRRVAGIISGAGGIKTGMLMGQRGSKADGSNPVALTGRAYCLVDASYGTIEAGDLLTTSETPGHAMKVADFNKAQGAILGKAMSSLDAGRDLVLVLVTLQ